MPPLRTTRVSLLARLRERPGEADVWSDFVATYGPAVVQWCRSHGLQHSDAHDVAQGVLVRFWGHAAKFRYDPAQRFRGYLRRMVVNAVSDWSAARRPDPIGGDGTALHDLMANIPARDSLVERIEEAYDMELLDAALREVECRVRPHTWQAFCLLAIEGVPAAAVASRLGMTVDNAYRARSYVLRLLRRAVVRLGEPAVDGERVTS
jgi:RNA polymerase sigma factor (sigma-70 family)